MIFQLDEVYEHKARLLVGRLRVVFFNVTVLLKKRKKKGCKLEKEV